MKRKAKAVILVISTWVTLYIVIWISQAYPVAFATCATLTIVGVVNIVAYLIAYDTILEIEDRKRK